MVQQVLSTMVCFDDYSGKYSLCISPEVDVYSFGYNAKGVCGHDEFKIPSPNKNSIS